jgi:hypothetical protein
VRRSGSLIAGEGHTVIMTLIVGLYAEFTGHGEAASPRSSSQSGSWRGGA